MAVQNVERREVKRLAALHDLRLLDTSPSESFDRITRMASHLFGLGIAAVSLTDLDRQWFKSRVGLDVESMPREGAPCAEVTANGSVLVIQDIARHPGYCDTPLASSGARFYAGAPLLTRDGLAIGALCVVGSTPRTFTNAETVMLRDMAAMVMAQVELQHAFGRIDPMSGLPNRTQCLDDLNDLVRTEARSSQRLVVVVDLASPNEVDHATRVIGANFLDDLVKEAADVLRSILGPTRSAYMLGASQIAFLAPSGVVEAEYLHHLAKMLGAIRQNASSRFVTTVSLGVARFDIGLTDPLDVLRFAHCAAQDARKTEGKVSLYSSEQDTLYRRRFDLINAFGQALDEPDQLTLVFQPRIALATGICVGAEALLRWTHSTLGAVSPAEFIPLIERMTLAKSMTMWVLNAALEQLAAWQVSDRDLVMAVNVSAGNLNEPDFAERVIALLQYHDVPAGRLELEITESAIMEDAGRALEQLRKLSEAGIRLAIDDFGTGHSSLSYLQILPIDTVKIDRAFIAHCTEGGKQRSLVETMTKLSHDLGFQVVAEGIETQAIADLLLEIGCDEGQGYLFARPMARDAFERWFDGADVVYNTLAA
ncbi:GGDEF domain-containing protein [Methylobacterium sp. WL30]|uniref:putative bifunctional diguanylate cyclase/phosphodiesterase n=1 Tax=unclassified Methylobacterium TaxID=2615210 RepID=UPI0011CC98DA|nr:MULTISPECIES: GGDEF and EAL domain-containing protein [unclassified Methylobacterium]TXN41226.1 GGDEF domain-containing protein [Methylobacterium sp. WL93]TXN50638.1 GGDEF domain-containing protein [Methylobacterium sp. WL119]TXN68253.1 GGDEF domain-containing protein [Methylobacterium sp. WL30]